MNIAVIGTGYVGLVTGACFSELGVNVTCIDKDEAKIAGLKKGVMPIYEPGLEGIGEKTATQHHLASTPDLRPAVEQSLVVLIAVDTRSDHEGQADLPFVKEVAA